MADYDVDTLKAATLAVQGHERLHNCLKRGSGIELNTNLKLLEESRNIKARLEGSYANYNGVKADNKIMETLRQLTLTNIPTAVSESSKTKFVTNVMELFGSSIDEILYAGLIWNPWYSSCVKEKNQRTKFNKLLIIYRMKPESFFSFMNRHEREKFDVFDMDWLYACDIFHFAHFLNTGKARFVEIVENSLRAPQCVLYCSTEFEKLFNFNGSYVLNKAFLKRCLLQSLGQVGVKKNKNFCIRRGTTLQTFCESFSLLYYVDCTLNKRFVNVNIDEDENLSNEAKVALELMSELYTFEQVKESANETLFELLTKWKENLEQECDNIEIDHSYSEFLSDWLASTRIGNSTLNTRTIGTEIGKVQELCHKLELSSIDPEKVVLIARAGSFMYDLHTKNSDEDYIVVYVEDTRNIVSKLSYWAECREKRGKDRLIEYGAYELRLFCEMLWKCSVVILEILFTDNHTYETEFWKEFTKHRKSFICENAIRQYLGLITKRLRHLEERRYGNEESKERKLFYQILHKVDACQRMMKNLVPNVRCSGELKETIMRIRLEPLENELSRENLLKKVTALVKNLKSDLVNREIRLRENVDFNLLNQLIMKSRGLNTI